MAVHVAIHTTKIIITITGTFIVINSSPHFAYVFLSTLILSFLCMQHIAQCLLPWVCQALLGERRAGVSQLRFWWALLLACPE